MKRIFYTTILLFAITTVNAQGLKGLIKKATKTDSTGKSSVGGLLGALSGGGNDSLSTNDVASGLKEALNVGVKKGTEKLSSVDGFLKNAAIKVLLPPEAQKVEKTLRGVGMGKLVDDAITSMNRAAEDATKSAAPIFLDAIKGITIQDAWGILRGNDTSATSYLKTKTTSPLTAAFKPVIEQSLTKVNATKYWSDLVNAYNKVNLFGGDKLNPDLSAYVTEKAITGIFYEVGQQEKDIRKNPLARTSDLLKKVFGN
ncbi:DUF4197 domain-containing protein [Foetidibacter luteolus]|uniref:DUF4197 domain-containing protein n=1 Tax=Foetidibacter luteolus TaxID=2608880 RepID=UPI00129B02C6|nr:DUF4197 domain-containing protein [Foetidibacter luteolus]